MEKEEGGYVLRSGRRKASMSFSDRSCPPSFLLFSLSPQEFVDVSNQMYIVRFVFTKLLFFLCEE
ncbi:hypothetical protein TS64_20115 [Aneurinibacillus migulanus]|nr:hypothetical protein [Aneurinibacillus migulanus]KIV53283.1 hypothetical protein TS64_20115 [Aneurinibacillus migulanus]